MAELMFTFCHLPRDIFGYISEFNDINDIFKLNETSKFFNDEDIKKLMMSSLVKFPKNFVARYLLDTPYKFNLVTELDLSYWKNNNERPRFGRLTDFTYNFQDIFSRFPNLNHYSTNYDIPGFNEFIQIPNQNECSTIKSLSFKGCQICVYQMKKISRFSNIEKLEFDNISEFGFIGEYNTYMPNDEYCTEFLKIMTTCTKLTHLTYKFLKHDRLLDIIKTNKKIKYLDLSFLSYTIDKNKLKTLIVSIGNNLETLILDHCTMVDTDLLMVIGKYCKNLQIFSLARNPNKLACDSHITNRGLISIFSNKKIRSLNISYNHNITNQAIIKLGESCSCLEKLTIKGCKNISDKAIMSMVNNCHNISDLNFDKCKVSDRSLIAIGKNCKKLKSISLEECHRISDNGIGAIANNCNKLVKINLKHTGINNKGVISIANKCPNLESINLSVFITNKSFFALANGCKWLRKINAQASKITDKAIVAITKKCNYIEELIISYTEVSGKSMKLISSKCHNLKLINTEGCLNVNYSDLQHIRDLHPFSKIY